MSPDLKKLKKEVNPRSISHRGIILFIIIFLLLCGSFIAFIFLFDAYYEDKIYPGTRIGQIDIGGQTYEQARLVLQDAMNNIVDEGLTFSYQGETFTVTSTVEDLANPELSSRLIAFDIDKTMDNIKSANWVLGEVEHIYYWLASYQVVPYLEIDNDKLIEALAEELSAHEQPAIDARLVIDEAYNITITPEKGGQAFNYPSILKRVKSQLSSLKSDTIAVALEQDHPGVTKTSADLIVPLVEQVLAVAPFTLVYEDYAWLVSKEQLGNWLVFKAANKQVTVGLDIDNDGLNAYFEEMAGIINVETREAKFAMSNGKVVEFQPSQQGRELQISESISNLVSKVKQVGISEINLIVNEMEPAVSTEQANEMGIRELIGQGSSNFSGSPKNRRHNIAVGADTLNGILIKPNEEFSLVKALGKIEASTGYLPELVIKGNKTIPEYGGGLCQIGTTTFRVAIDAGFPITERKNHSYRVSYYEPAGTDATIYDPKPDLKFINDTGNYVLFTTEISGNELIFRFYGTSDGRQVEYTKPRVYNYVKPGPTKLVETTDLAPGQKKCTERAHTGADAEFTRTVTYADEEKKVDVFSSHYKPWQEVCLIGVEELSEEAG